MKRLGLYGEDLSRLVRRSREAAFASIVPPGTDTSLKTLTQHFVLGYFRQVPAGLILSNQQRTCAVLIRAFMLPVRSHRLCRLPILNAFDASSRDC
jgi:hypothetical protein